MKRLLLIAGIVLLIACVLCVSVAVLHRSAYRHALDGSPELYQSLHQRMIIFFGIGAVLAAMGIACLTVYFRK